MLNSNTFERFSRNSIKVFLFFTLLFFTWFVFVVGIQENNIILFGLISVLFFAHKTTRKFLYCFSPFIAFVLLYDSLRILHDLNLFSIHTSDLFALDKSIFGLNHEGSRISLNEYLLLHRNSVLDFLSGAFYLTWVPFPLLFGFYLFLKKEYKLVFNFWLCFLITNLIGFLGYIFYPAAPPWYYFEFGSEVIKDTIGQPAGLGWFDDIIGFPVFTNMYSQSANVFGAVPSLHAAYPMILSYYSFKNKNIFLSVIFLITMLGIWFAALYTTHHYMIDVVLGMLCAVLGIFVSEQFIKKTTKIK